MDLEREYNDLTASQKAAIVLLSLEKDTAAKIMRTMSPDCLEKITSAIWFLEDVSEEERSKALIDLTEKMKSNPLVGGADKAKELLVEVVGDEMASELIEKAKNEETTRQAFRSLINIKSTDLAGFLVKEQPSTISIVLGFLPASKVAEILSCMDEDVRNEVISRLASPKPAKQDIVKRIERVFIRNIVNKISSKSDKDADRDIGGPKVVAEIIQNLDKETGDNVMKTLQEESPQVANEVSQELFTFEDIMRISAPDMQRVMRDVPMEKLPLALRGVTDELFNHFANNLSKRARENLVDEMSLMGKVKLMEVRAAQNEIVQVIRSLDAAGEISLSMGGGEEDAYV